MLLNPNISMINSETKREFSKFYEVSKKTPKKDLNLLVIIKI